MSVNSTARRLRQLREVIVRGRLWIADPASLFPPAAPMGMDLVRLAEVGSQHALGDRRPRFAALSVALLVAPVLVKNGGCFVAFLAKNIVP